MEFFIGLLALVGSMILIGKYWRYVWRVAGYSGVFGVIISHIGVHDQADKDRKQSNRNHSGSASRQTLSN
jgi:hypothetical protein